jgi:hypothetical protein
MKHTTKPAEKKRRVVAAGAIAEKEMNLLSLLGLSELLTPRAISAALEEYKKAPATPAERRRAVRKERSGRMHYPDPREGAMEIGKRQYLVMEDGSLRRIDGRRIRHSGRHRTS